MVTTKLNAILSIVVLLAFGQMHEVNSTDSATPGPKGQPEGKHHQHHHGWIIAVVSLALVLSAAIILAIISKIINRNAETPELGVAIWRITPGHSWDPWTDVA